MYKKIFTAVLLIGLIAPASLMAQDVEQVPQQIILTPQHQGAVSDFLKDEEQLWKSPFHVRRADAKWLVPLGVGAAALFATDHRVTGAMQNDQGIRPASNFLSNLGGTTGLALATGSFYGIGKLTHNEKAADTGKLAAEAMLHTQVIVQGMKLMFDRERPGKIGGNGAFWGGGSSFPSGHAATSFAFATIVAHQYKDKKLVAVGAYGLATAVSLSRIGGLNHQPSDVLIGATVGYLIGQYVLHHHPAEN